MSFGDDTLDPANGPPAPTSRQVDGLASERTLGHIADAIMWPDRFAHRIFGQSPTLHRARAVSNRLIYDDEQLVQMGLAGGGGSVTTFTRAREADGATQEFTPAERAEAGDPDAPLFDTPRLDTSLRGDEALDGVTYHWRLPTLARYGQALAAAGEPVPFVALIAFVIAVAAFVLAFFALVT